MNTFLQIVSANDLPTLGAGLKEMPDARFLFEIDGTEMIAGYWREASSTARGRVETCLLFDVSVQEFHLLERRPVTAAVIRLLPDRQVQVEHWRSDLNERRDEARESIRREGVAFESWFSFELNNHFYLFAFMAARQPITPNHDLDELEVDRIHRAFKCNWDRDFRYLCTPLTAAGQA